MSWNPPGAPPYGQTRPTFPTPPQQRPGYQAPSTLTPRSMQIFPPGQTPPLPSTTTRVWTEHTSPDGRTYYHNVVTKESIWDKPDELKTPEEKALGSCPWKEFTSEGGRKYYYNSVTQVSKWEMPAEYKEFLEKLEKDQKNKESTSQTAVSPSQQDFERARQLSIPAVSPVNVTPISTPVRPHVPILHTQQPEQPKIEFETKEEAVAAFRQLLKDSGVKPDWSWEQTMRAIISNPMYRAIKTLTERKQAFHDYVDEMRKKEEEEKKAKIIKVRQDFISLLESHPEVNSSTRYRKVCEVLGEEPAFLAVEDERLREEIFSEYIYDLRKQEKEIQRAVRKENMEKFSHLLKSLLSITESTRWTDAQSVYTNAPEYQQDKKLQEMDMLDFLAVYEEHIRSLERETAEKKKKEMETQTRQQRRNRDAYRALMEELRQKNIITAKSKWKEIYPVIHDDERYLNMLGQPGSSPLELFWDVVEELDEILYQQRKVVSEVLKAKDLTLNPGVTFEQFQYTLGSDERIISVNEFNLKVIFEQLQRKQERRQRRKLDAFRSVFKNFETMITPEATWEQVRPVVEKTEEFHAIESEEQRIEVFNKFMDRVKEKLLRKGGEESEEEEGTIKDDDLEDDKHASSDRKRKHKSHRSYHHRRSHHYSDYSADSADYSDKDRDGGDRRKRRKPKTKYESRYVESRYQDHDRFTEPKRDHVPRSSRSPKPQDYKSYSPKSEEHYKNNSPQPNESFKNLKIQSPKQDEPQLMEVSKHADSSAEEGDCEQILEFNEECGFGKFGFAKIEGEN
ncbi:7909_t:CDS:10 [Acaulospora morrowiae]|uniref:7909_t:CDS:1 n=1 Tax=Acaulospora morrowiae TaxID=94023 RepID=A0A9N8VML7_9GLOM|nr:7909_t:CDS:10 [Acaulospora morrowiae]